MKYMRKNPIESVKTAAVRSLTDENAEKRYQHYLAQAVAPNTRRAYRAAIRQFEASAGLLPADESAIARYITEKALLLNPRTLSLHLTALSNWHRYYEMPDPTQTLRIRQLLHGIQREHGQPKRKAKALRTEHLHTILSYLSHDENKLKAVRDSALMQIAYFGAFRRSELVTLCVEHLKFEPEGLLIFIPKSKTDQTHVGKVKALPYGQADNAICPVRGIKAWLAVSGITSGRVFRAINRWGHLQDKPLNPNSINLILKSLGKKCQFDFISDLSSHSLRRGFATSAARAGAAFESIKRQGGWQNDSTVRDYIEEGQLFDENAAKQLLDFYFKQ
jgi:integrase